MTADGTASPFYGISTTLRDYGLFHQWIAQGKAPTTFYSSLADQNKDRLGDSDTGKAMSSMYETPVAYASQVWYMPEHKILFTLGSYGQLGFSDLESGIAVVFMQDWEDNSVPSKAAATVARALLVINRFISR